MTELFMQLCLILPPREILWLRSQGLITLCQTWHIHLAVESQDQCAFTWEGQQWTFQVFLQVYLHSCTICHVMVAQNLSLFSFLTSVKWAHFIDDIVLTCEDLCLPQKTPAGLAGPPTEEWMGLLFWLLLRGTGIRFTFQATQDTPHL